MPTTPTIWSSAVTAHTNAGDAVQNAVPLGLPGGGYLEIWEDFFGEKVGLQFFDAAGTKVGVEHTSISSQPTDSTVSVMALPGGFGIVYRDDPGVIWLDTFDFNANRLSSPSQSNQNSSISADSVASYPNGDYVMGYEIDNSQSHMHEVDLLYVNAGVGNPNSPTLAPSGHAVDVAILSNGDVVCVWTNIANGIDDIYFSIHTALREFVAGGVVPGAANSGVVEQDAHVAALKHGGFAVVWDDEAVDGSSDGIGLTVFDNSGTPDPHHSGIIANQGNTTGSQVGPDIVALADGSFLVAWDDGGTIRGHHFTAAGDPIGGIFLIGSGHQPRGTLLSDGRVAYGFFDERHAYSTIIDPRASTFSASGLIYSSHEGATVIATGATNTLIGLEGPDTLEGAAGIDTLKGGAGKDTLIGGGSADLLFGGTGRDTFKFVAKLDSLPKSGHDVIEDFSHADHDRISLAMVDANTKLAGNQAFHLVDPIVRTSGGHKVFDYSQSFQHYHQDHPGSTWAGLLRSTAAGLVPGDVNGDGKVDFEMSVPHVQLLKGDFVL